MRKRVHRPFVRFASLLVLAPLVGACGSERPNPLVVVVDDTGADTDDETAVCFFDTNVPEAPLSLRIIPRTPLVLVDPGRSTPLSAKLTFAVDPATLPVTFTVDDPSLGTFTDSTFHVSATGFTGERWTSVRATGGGVSDEVRLLVLAIPGAEDPDPSPTRSSSTAPSGAASRRRSATCSSSSRRPMATTRSR